MNEPILTIENLHITFSTPDGDVEAVKGLSLELFPGEILGIAGESGSGKSQTWMAPLGLLADNSRVSGKISFGGRDLLNLNVRDLNKVRGAELAMVFQDPMTSLNPYLKIGLQLLESIQIHQPELSKSEAKFRCLDMLKRVALTEPETRFNQFPHELSGGMRQRVMIAMALLNQPRVLIADEPTTALDVTIQAEILDLLRELQRDFGMAVVFITHDLAVIAKLCDRVAIMYAGEVQEVGVTSDILNRSKHPYTQSLLAAIPRIDGSRGEAA
ncbi:MAG: ABC transporter ATP-binding protein [Alphaproteobacteria bacterium]